MQILMSMSWPSVDFVERVLLGSGMTRVSKNGIEPCTLVFCCKLNAGINGVDVLQ